MIYTDVRETAKKWQMTERRITMLCRDGKIPGAKKDGKSWLIPTDASRPFDGRTKEARVEKSVKSSKGEKKKMGKKKM